MTISKETKVTLINLFCALYTLLTISIALWGIKMVREQEINMKVKQDFITNSSSTNYIVTSFENKLTAEQFVILLFLNSEFRSEMLSYDFDYNMESVITSLEEDYSYFPMKEGKYFVSFGDENGTIAGRIFDYCLRQGFSCDDFHVRFESWAR